MNPERWQRIEQLYHAALERAAPQRAVFLAEACADDLALRREVEALLVANDQAEGFLDEDALKVEAKEIAANRLSAPVESLATEHFSHYKILSKLGAGGMGEVFLARDLTLQRPVAIKVLPSHFTTDANRLQRFVREAKAASALNHPGIITIYEIGQSKTESGPLHFIATEYIEGVTLRTRLAEGALTLQEALDVAVQLAAALDAAHRAGILHRDIKPENIMLRPDGLIKILDFGLAKLTQPRQTLSKDGVDSHLPTLAQVHQTDTGMVMGTPRYMSPEQARGLRVDARTDIFSLGVLLYEMIAGRRPFEGNTPMDVLAAILNQEPPPLTSPPSDEATPIDALQRIVSKALNKQPDERYQTMQDLLLDLRTLRQEVEFQQRLGQSQSPGARHQQPMSKVVVRTIEADKSTTASQASDTTHIHSSIEIILGEIKQHRTGVGVMVMILVFVVAAGGYGLYRLINQSRQAKTFLDLKFSRLTSTGNVIGIPAPAISPNGQYTAYVVEEGNQYSLWMKQVATGSTVQVVVPADVSYEGLTFSPDSNYIYYSVGDGRTTSILYRVPALGGASVRILGDVNTAISFSPDGLRFAFASGFYTTLMIASSDGQEVQKLFTQGEEELLTRPAWSPDGKTIVCAAPRRKTSESGLIAVNAKDGTVKRIGDNRWSRVVGVGWLSGGNHLVICATEKGSRNYQLWRVSYPDGEAHRMTNDLSNYFGVSLTADARQLVSTRQDTVCNLWIAPDGDAARARQITAETGAEDGLDGIAWTPDGKIVYTSLTASGTDLWIVDATGDNRRQLTFNVGKNYFPAVSGDGRYIVFVSNRDANLNLWRMDIDGGNLKRLTDGPESFFKPQCLPNNPQIVCHFLRNQQPILGQLPIDGGTPTPLTDVASRFPSVSSDGKFIACLYGTGTQESPLRVAILPVAGGTPLQLLNLPSVIRSPGFQWMPDGKGLAYLDAADKVVNVWTQPLKGGPPKQLTDFKTDSIFYFAWSRDGRHLAYARGRETSDLILVSNFQ